MGLFEKAGRRFEQFKQEAVDAAGDDAGYECTACGTGLDAASNYCPECGADAVVPVEPSGETPDGDSGESRAVDGDPSRRVSADGPAGDQNGGATGDGAGNDEG